MKSFISLLILACSLSFGATSLHAENLTTSSFASEPISAKQGDAEAQLNLGVMYEKGLGLTQDYIKAFEWISKAANQGDAKSQSI